MFFDMSKAPTELTIGALSEQTGVDVETIRYYEREGLLPNAPRTAGGHRVFDQARLGRLIFIHRSRELGFSGTEVRTLLGMVDGGYTCGEVRDLTGQISQILCMTSRSPRHLVSNRRYSHSTCRRRSRSFKSGCAGPSCTTVPRSST